MANRTMYAMNAVFMTGPLDVYDILVYMCVFVDV